MDLHTLALVALAVGPVITIIVFFYAKDKNDREPFGVLLMSFFWGCFSVLPAIILEYLLPHFIPDSQGTSLASMAIYTFGIVAVSEEGSKFIFLRYYSFRKRSFNEPYDGIMYAIMVGMGFATIENLLYIFGADTPQSRMEMAGIRAVTAIPAHATFAAVMGYYVGLAKFRKAASKRLMAEGVFYAVLFHGAYDFFLFQQYSPGMYLGAILSLYFGLRFTFKAIRIHKKFQIGRAREPVLDTEPVISNGSGDDRPG